MKDNLVGEIILNLRTKNKISQAELARGIIHNRELSRIENGTKIPNKTLLDAIFQRLGKSADRIDNILSYEEYQLFIIRYNIEYSLIENDLVKCSEYLKDCEKRNKNESNLYRQYILFIKSIILLENVNIDVQERLKKSLQILNEAINITYKEWEDINFKNTYLCVQELQILSLIGFLKWEIDQDVSGKKILQEVVDYAKLKIDDEQELSKIYPHALFYLSQITFNEGEYEETVRNCKLAINSLIRYGDLALIRKLLLLIRSCSDKEVKIRLVDIEEYIGVIDKILEESKSKKEISYYTLVLLTNIQSDFSLSSELIANYRESSGLSQEELAYEICSYETISRIERGKNSPQPNKFYQIMEKLNVDKDFFGGYILSDDYDAYMNVSKFIIALQNDKIEEASEYLLFIRGKVDDKNVINRQFLDAGALIIQRKRNEISKKEMIVGLKKILAYRGIDNIYDLDHVPSREEVFIINQIINQLKFTNRYTEAIKIYEAVIQEFDESIVDEIFHATSLFLLLTGYSEALEVNNDLVKALETSDRAIQLSVRSRRSELLCILFANRCCIYEKCENNSHLSQAKQSLLMAYYLAKTFNNNNAADKYKVYFENSFHEKISD